MEGKFTDFNQVRDSMLRGRIKSQDEKYIQSKLNWER